MYGEDGMDISKSKFLKPKLFPFLSDNVSNIIPNNEFLEQLKDCDNFDNVIKYKKKVRVLVKQLRTYTFITTALSRVFSCAYGTRRIQHKVSIVKPASSVSPEKSKIKSI